MSDTNYSYYDPEKDALREEVARLREMERHWRELYFQASRVPATPQTPVLPPSEAVLDPIERQRVVFR